MSKNVDLKMFFELKPEEKARVRKKRQEDVRNTCWWKDVCHILNNDFGSPLGIRINRVEPSDEKKSMTLNGMCWNVDDGAYRLYKTFLNYIQNEDEVHDDSAKLLFTFNNTLTTLRRDLQLGDEVFSFSCNTGTGELSSSLQKEGQDDQKLDPIHTLMGHYCGWFADKCWRELHFLVSDQYFAKNYKLYDSEGNSF